MKVLRNSSHGAKVKEIPGCQHKFFSHGSKPGGEPGHVSWSAALTDCTQKALAWMFQASYTASYFWWHRWMTTVDQSKDSFEARWPKIMQGLLELGASRLSLPCHWLFLCVKMKTENCGLPQTKSRSLGARTCSILCLQADFLQSQMINWWFGGWFNYSGYVAIRSGARAIIA